MRTILVDCDGVLGDYNQAYLDVVNKLGKTNHQVSDLTDWDMDLCLKIPSKIALAAKDVVAEKGFCSSIPVLPGAQLAIRRLQEKYDVVCVTAHTKSRNWVYERDEWLYEHFGIYKVIHTTYKEHVQGSMLVDDKPDNLLRWRAANPSGLAVLYARPYNSKVRGWFRRDWTTLVDDLEGLLWP